MSGSPFVTTAWLADNLHDENVKIVDASWYLPAMNRDALGEYLSGHIPGAVFFDIDAISDITSSLPHMLASPQAFANAVGEMGIGSEDLIIVYDSIGLFSAARVWWNFQIMGAQSKVLAGGLPKWREEARPLHSGAENPEPAVFIPSPFANAAASAKDVQAALAAGQQVVDMRAAARFTGEVPEPRPGLASGHMPGAKNIPFSELIAGNKMLPADQLWRVFEAHHVDPRSPLISSCGSGVTAPLLNLALASMGIEAMRVYDGSWAEWGGRPDLPVVKGEA